MEMLPNLNRARSLMAQEGLDGLIAAVPLNVYYFSDYQGLLMSAERFDAAYFTVVPADEHARACLVLPSMELRRLVSAGGTWMSEVFIYTHPHDEPDGIVVDGPVYSGWPSRNGARLTELEQAWVAATRAQEGRVSGNAQGALTRALRAAGLELGRVATDDVRVGDWLAQAGFSALECRHDASLFNRIRAIKTPAEIRRLKIAADINERALFFAAQSFSEGANWQAVEIAYATAMAAEGGQASYVICGAGGPPNRVIQRGEPMFLDALGTWRGYHGDLGRCVVLGEASGLMRQRHGALVAGWEAVQPLIRPGTRYTELADTVVAAVRDSGLPEFVYATPHGVGLEHTDDPKPAGTQQGLIHDVVLEPGMVLNIDMPFTELGWGSVHIEDTVHVTEDGFERLTHSDLDIIEVDAG